jgi:hypothetical protein
VLVTSKSIGSVGFAMGSPWEVSAYLTDVYTRAILIQIIKESGLATPRADIEDLEEVRVVEGENCE